MTLIYNPKDVFIVQRNDTSSSFVETILRSTPNSVVIFDSGSTITTLSTSSFAESIVSASLANFTSSNAIHAFNADSASFLLKGANIYLSASYIHSVTTAVEPPFETGQLYWSQLNHTYAIDTDIAGLDLDIGQQEFTRVIAGEFIPAGSVVYINGIGAGLPLIFLALSDGTKTKSSVAGICPINLSTGDEGFIVSSGRADNINTFGLTPGISAYLSSTTPGGLQSSAPIDPFEKVIVGIVLLSNPTSGKILVSITGLPSLTSPYVGMIEVPSLVDHGNQTFTVGSARGNFCSTSDGLGEIKTYTLPTATFSASVGTFAQYVLGTFNSGSPVYSLTTDRSLIDEVQTIPVFSTITPVAGVNFTDWDSAGTLLANKQNLRIIQLYGVQRATGLNISTSGSYIVITSGSAWYGVKEVNIPAVNTSNTSSSPLSFYSHTTGSWSTTAIPTGQFINGQYDDGTNLQTLSSGSFVVNYVYKTINTGRTILTLSDQFTNLNLAEIASPPIPPTYFSDFAILVGRIVVQSGSNTPYQVNSVFDRVPFPPSEPPYHNGLQGLQGGSGSNEFYHLSSASFSQIMSEEIGTASLALRAISSSNADTSSFALLSNTASVSSTASYLNPGATLYVVNDNTFASSSYIEPFNLPTIPYNPPYKEGRMFYNSDFHNWIYYTDQNFQLHVGKEVLFQVNNPYNITLPQLSAVYLSGSTGNQVNAFLAQADGTGLHFQAVGVIRSDIPSGSKGYVLLSGVMHEVNMTGFSPGDAIFLSSTTPGGIVNILPGSPSENVRLGYCMIGGPSGSFVSQPRIGVLPGNAFAGMTLLPTVVDNGNATVTISTSSVNLFSDPTGNGSIINYPLLSGTFSVPTGSSSFIFAQFAGGSASYGITQDRSIINETTIVPTAVVAQVHPGDIHTLMLDTDGLALANKLQERLIATEEFSIQNGFNLFETGSRNVGITAGTVWYGASNSTASDFNSNIPSNQLHFYFHNGSSAFTHSDVTQYNNSQYDNGTSLQPLSASTFAVNYIYRLLGTSTSSIDASFVIGTNQYLTVADAAAASIPSNIPNEITDLGVLVGRIIVLSGSNTASRVDSTVAGSTFLPSTITNHESLAGLQGGTAGQHEHLTTLEYSNFQNATGTGVYVRQTGSLLINANITGSITTASFATHAISSDTASFATLAQTASFVQSAQTASFVTTAQTASFITSSNVIGKVSAAINADTASFITSSNVIGKVTSAITADTASFITSAQTASFVQLSQTASFALSSNATTLFTASTYQITASQAVNAATAITASFAQTTPSSSFSQTASWANNSAATTLFTASIYQITSSVSVTSLTAALATTASFASNAKNASTASFALGVPGIKSGILSGSQFQGAPRTASAAFASPFVDNNYSITVTGETSRTWTIQNKVSGSFQINSNNNGAIANNTFWQAIYVGEYYS